jgi:hypothetical protein
MENVNEKLIEYVWGYKNIDTYFYDILNYAAQFLNEKK